MIRTIFVENFTKTKRDGLDTRDNPLVSKKPTLPNVVATVERSGPLVSRHVTLVEDKQWIPVLRVDGKTHSYVPLAMSQDRAFACAMDMKRSFIRRFNSATR